MLKYGSIFGILILTLIFSCSKSSEPSIPKCLLLSVNSPDYKIVYNYGSDGEMTSYKYVTPGVDSVVLSAVYDSHGNITQVGTTKYTYDANNRITAIVDSDGVVYNKNEFQYNSYGQLVKRLEYHVENGQPYTYDNFTYSNLTSRNPLTQSRYFSNGTMIETITFGYDNKYNPYAGSHELWSLSTIAVNNITWTTSSTGMAVDGITYAYTYNEKGYPLTAAQHNGSTLQTTTYTYNCK